MPSDYDIEVHHRPGLILNSDEKHALRADMCALGAACRSSSVKRILFSNLFMGVLSHYPQGVWITNLTQAISSLVHTAKYARKVFPSPEWERKRGSKPSGIHLRIAREISEKHMSKMLISPDATFDEERFVFLGSNDWDNSRVLTKDLDDIGSWHCDDEATQYFRKFFRRGAGDEVLQIGFLDLSGIMQHMDNEDFSKNEGGIISRKYKIGSRDTGFTSRRNGIGFKCSDVKGGWMRESVFVIGNSQYGQTRDHI